MKKISRHDGPFGRRNCCVRFNENTRRERKWIGRMSREPRSRSIRGMAGFWMVRGLLAIMCIENGVDLPRPTRAKRRRARQVVG